MARCLIIDDSDAMREIAADLLDALGHDVTEAAGPEAAVTALHGAAVPFELVLLDWDLPTLGALDVLRAVGELDVKPEIVLCATENDPRQFKLAAAAGARFHVLKPFDRAALEAVLRDAEVARAA